MRIGHLFFDKTEFKKKLLHPNVSKFQVGVPVPAPYAVPVAKPVAVPVPQPVAVPVVKSVVTSGLGASLYGGLHGHGLASKIW